MGNERYTSKNFSFIGRTFFFLFFSYLLVSGPSLPLALYATSLLTASPPHSDRKSLIVVGGHDLDAIRSTVGTMVCPQPKGTLFVTPGTQLYDLAAKEVDTLVVSFKVCYVFLYS